MAAELNITKVAVGCTEIETLRERMAARAVDGETFITTRFRPKREGELVGGSLYWIIKHKLVARQEILGFEEEPDGKRCRILLSATLHAVRPHPKRAHQGWRYLTGADAPTDLDAGEAEGMAALPREMAAELSALYLI
jgi:hypothetical protein